MTLSQHFRLAGMATMLSALLAVPAVEAADKTVWLHRRRRHHYGARERRSY